MCGGSWLTWCTDRNCWIWLCRILGAQNANLPKITGALALVLGRGSDLARPEDLERMAVLLRQLQQAIPEVPLSANPVKKVTQLLIFSAISDNVTFTASSCIYGMLSVFCGCFQCVFASVKVWAVSLCDW